MPYYDPSQWLDKDDALLPDVETQISVPKYARTPKRYRQPVASSSAGKTFKPPYGSEYDVVDKFTNDVILTLVEWHDTIGKVYIELRQNERFIRKGHYNTDDHRNPDRNLTYIPPPHHMHFPTGKYPDLMAKRKYAYPIESDSDYLSCIRSFCNNTEIDYHTTQWTMFPRGL